MLMSDNKIKHCFTNYVAGNNLLTKFPLVFMALLGFLLKYNLNNTLLLGNGNIEILLTIVSLCYTFIFCLLFGLYIICLVNSYFPCKHDPITIIVFSEMISSLFFFITYDIFFILNIKVFDLYVLTILSLGVILNILYIITGKKHSEPLAPIYFLFYPFPRRDKKIIVDLNFIKSLITAFFLISSGVSSVFFYRRLQPYPAYGTAEFSHIGKPLQMIDFSEYYKIAEKGPFLIPHILIAFACFLFGIHPLPIFWILAFFQGIIISVGIYYVIREILADSRAALVGAFLIQWIWCAASVQNNPQTVTSGTCLLYTSPSPRDLSTSRMPSSA